MVAASECGVEGGISHVDAPEAPARGSSSPLLQVNVDDAPRRMDPVASRQVPPINPLVHLLRKWCATAANLKQQHHRNGITSTHESSSSSVCDGRSMMSTTDLRTDGRQGDAHLVHAEELKVQRSEKRQGLWLHEIPSNRPVEMQEFGGLHARGNTLPW